MKRTLSLVLALVMVLGSFSAVFAAEEEVVNEAAEILYDLGILREYRLDDQLERRDAVILLARLLGEEEEAKEFEAEGYPTWEDNTDPFYDGYLAWAEVNGYFEGVAEGKFSPRTHLTAQDFSLVLLRALGYDVKGHDAWKKALETAEEAGLLVDLEVEEKDVVSRGLMAVLVLNTLKAEVVGEGVTLAEKLGYELPEEVPAELEIVSVTADNLKEVEVVFNQEVDEETVVNANFTIKNIETEVVLKEDGKTAVVTVSPELKNQKEYTLVVEKVKAVTGVEIEKTEVKFKAFDAQLPEVVGLEVTGPRHLTLTFSEPLDENVKGKVTIKQDKVTLGNSTDVEENKVKVELYTNLVEGKEYEVTVENFVDYAGYKNVIEVLTFTYEKDETPPVATVEKVEQEYVVISFNKPVKGLAANKFYHTFTAWIANNIYRDADKTPIGSKPVDKVYVYFYEIEDNKGVGNPIPAGSTTLGIKGAKIEDNWGNALGNVEFTITAAADRTAPEVKEIKVVGEDTIRVIFTKDVKTLTRENVEILDEDGEKIKGLYIAEVVAKSAKEYDIKLNKNIPGEVITISIKDVEDTTLFGNVLSLYTEIIEITDKTEPNVEKAYYKVTGPDKDGKYEAEIYVQFSESVDPETALTISNYSLVFDNKVTLLDGNAEFDVVDSRVKLTLTSDKAKEFKTLLDKEENSKKVLLQVINVEDLAGNAIIPEQKTLTGDVSTAKAVTYTVEATAKNKIVVKFSDLLSNIKNEDFAITTGEDVYGKGFTLTQTDDTVTTLTFELGKDYELSTDASDLVFVINGDHDIKNSFGEKADFKQVEIKDKIKPEIKKVAVEGNEVTITFTEDMLASLFNIRTFEVENAKVTKVDPQADQNGYTKEIKLTVEPEENAEIVVGGEIRISYKNDVEDANGNTLDMDKNVFKAFKVK